MRKIITSSVLILLFSLFSGQAFAGKVEACELIKHDPAYKGLYGLCNAYWNADENAQEKILAKFVKKAGPDGPGMPGLDDPEPEPIECPCWTEEYMLVAACSHTLTFADTGGPLEVAQFDFGDLLFLVDDFDLNGSCLYQSAYDPENSAWLPTTAEENQTCRAAISTLANSDLLDLCE